MNRRPPRPTLTYTLLPYTPRFRSPPRDRCPRTAKKSLMPTRMPSSGPAGFPAARRAAEAAASASSASASTKMNGSIVPPTRSEEHTYELQSLLRISFAVFCLQTKNNLATHTLNKFHHYHTHH